MNSGNGLSRKMSSSEIAGISPYDVNGLIIHISFIDNKLLVGDYKRIFLLEISTDCRRRFGRAFPCGKKI
jgi:hypothetical protein